MGREGGGDKHNMCRVYQNYFESVIMKQTIRMMLHRANKKQTFIMDIN